jgi:hypothetical protein
MVTLPAGPPLTGSLKDSMTRQGWFHLLTSVTAKSSLMSKLTVLLLLQMTHKDMATMFSDLRNCVRIILGASHDNGYARLLRQLETDGVTTGKVVLLEGVPFAMELENLIGATFPRIKFPGVFVEQKFSAAVVESGTKYSTIAASGVLSMSDGKSKSPTLKSAVVVFKPVNPDSGTQLNQ